MMKEYVMIGYAIRKEKAVRIGTVRGAVGIRMKDQKNERCE